MASQEILVTYKAEVDQLTQELKKIVAAQDQITKEQKEGQAQINKNLTNQEQAAKKRVQLLKLEEKELAKLKQLRALAFDPKVIRDYDAQINRSLANIKTLGGKTQEALGGIGSQIRSIGVGIGAGIAAAFSVQAIINFGQASVNAFLEAEESATRLRFAIQSIGGEGDAAFNSLVAQASRIQKEFGIADETIQDAQASLASFGLSSQQIELAIPALVDFATVTGQDIPSAVQAMGQAIQGRAGEFKKFGVQVSETATEVDNFNAILSGLASQEGAAATQAKTLNGELRIQEAQVAELQEQVGSGLAPAWLAVKKATFEATLQVIDYFKFGGNIALGQFSKLVKEQGTAFDEVNDKVKERTKELIEAGHTQEVASQAAINDIRFEILARLDLRKVEAESAKQNQTISEAERRLTRLKLNGVQNELKAINQITEAFKQQQIEADKLLSSEQLKLISTEELNKLLTENGKLNSLIGQSNVKLINNELQARKKLNEEGDKRIAGSAEEVKAIQTLSSEYAAFFELLSNEDKTQLIELSITGAADLEAEAKEKIKILEDLFKKNGLELPVEVDPDRKLISFDDQLNKLIQELEANNIEIPVTVNSAALDNFRAKVAQLKIDSEKEITIPVKLEVPADRQNVTMNTGIPEAAESDLAIWFDRNEQILSSSEQLFSELVALSQQYTSNQIEQINERTNKQLEAFDAIQEKNQELFKKGAITERAALNNEKQLEAERVRIATEAEKKIADLKRKQFNIDKAAALIEIAINTAKAISTAIGPQAVILIPLYSALGAAQAALVASQPNPYKKGTKSSKEGLALVDEEGSEAIFSPTSGRLTVLEKGTKVLPAKQTKTYGEVLDAMYDKRFDKYIMQNYVTPALNKQKATFEKTKQQRFADNIKESIVLNGSGLTGYDLELNRRKGFNINNVDEFAQALAYHQRRSYKR